MIECHPLLRPIVHLAKPVVHTVKTWRPRVHHHIHRAIPSQTVMTVCQRVAGPIVAGGLVLLPPASAVPPAGGVGGFPGAIVPEYGAPAFVPGFSSPANAYAPGTGYGPSALGLGPVGVLAPGGIVGSNAPGTTTPTLAPTVVASNTPGTTTPTTPGSTSPGTTTPPDTPTTPTGGGTPPGTTTPPDTTPPGGNPPGTTTPPDTPTTPVPEPASLAVLATALAAGLTFRSLWARRDRRS